MIIAEIQSDINIINENDALFVETNFNNRAEALDFIDFHIIDRIEGLLQNDIRKNELEALKKQADEVKAQLEAIDTNLFEKLSDNIRNGVYVKSSFRSMVNQYPGLRSTELIHPEVVGYDNLDVFINGLLYRQAIPEPSTTLAPEMVFYQKTPARVVFELMEQLEFNDDDVFVDIGSGFGQVVMLANLLTGVHAIGIEYEPAYCDYARMSASQLNMDNISFINNDALKTDYSDGTVFFLYTPFSGAMLQQFLELLRNIANKRIIRVVTYGPCSAKVSQQSWLRCLNGHVDNPYSLCVFTS